MKTFLLVEINETDQTKHTIETERLLGGIERRIYYMLMEHTTGPVPTVSVNQISQEQAAALALK